MPPSHDALYHRLFGHPIVVEQLLREFVGSPVIDGLDLEGMERLNAKFHGQTGQRREGDMIWRIPRRDGGDSYLVLLLEFQSTSDHWMALRIHTYAGLLWQQLVSEKRLPSNRRLPPILPVVLYNGQSRWRAPDSIRKLVGLPDDSPLLEWQPQTRYHLIDQGAFTLEDLEERDTFLPLLFRLERSPDLRVMAAVAEAAVGWFARYPGLAAVRLLYADLLGSMLVPLVPDARVPEGLLEERNMLAEKIERWVAELKEQSILAGHQEGLQAGLEEGRQAGRLEGKLEGKLEGEATFLLRLLEHKFGALPDQARERILAADIATLEQWGVRVLSAESLEAVLA